RGCRRLHPRSGRGRTRAARAVRARRWSPARGWRCRDGRADDRRGTGGGGEADTGPRRRSERMSEQAVTAVAEGPYFDELAVGQVFDSAPGVTLTPGLAGVHQSIVGDRLALPLDAALCAEVTGGSSLAHPALVWDLAIGQSTVATHHVKANLFYRGLVFRRTPVLGDTLRTTTEVVALRQNRPREGRRPTGLAALRITTVDQHDRPVLDFWRCAMLPLRDAGARTGSADDLESVGAAPDRAALAAVVDGWHLDRFARRVSGPRFAELRV